MSYDSIKAHGGEIKVETKEGEGSEFVIQLPKRPIVKKMVVLIIFCTGCTYAQQSKSDSLLMLFSKAKEVTTRVNILSQLS